MCQLQQGTPANLWVSQQMMTGQPQACAAMATAAEPTLDTTVPLDMTAAAPSRTLVTSCTNKEVLGQLEPAGLEASRGWRGAGARRGCVRRAEYGWRLGRVCVQRTDLQRSGQHAGLGCCPQGREALHGALAHSRVSAVQRRPAGVTRSGL